MLPGHPRAGQFLRRQAPEHDARLPDRSRPSSSCARPSATHYHDRPQAASRHEIVDERPGVRERHRPATTIDVTISRRRSGTRTTAAATSAPARYNVTRDPDEGWINCGTYRVHDPRRQALGFYISPGKHGRIHRDKYEARGEPMPVAIVVGGDPMTFLMASQRGALRRVRIRRGRRLSAASRWRCVNGKDHRPAVPGQCRDRHRRLRAARQRAAEGPFGEWTGYYASDVRTEPVMDIKAIYHRNNPIMLGCPPQRPPDELARYRAVTRSALLQARTSTKAGVPDVTRRGRTRSARARMLRRRRRSSSAIPAMPSQAGHVAASAMSAPMPASTSSSSTTTSTCRTSRR